LATVCAFGVFLVITIVSLLAITQYAVFDGVFTALHGMQTLSSDENVVCLSVGLSNA